MSFFKRKAKESDAKPAVEKKPVPVPGPPPTPLQLLVKEEDGTPVKMDGSDKYFGMENVVKNNLQDEYEFANTCYCNSIMQCLYFSKAFRENVVNFPHRALLPGSPLPGTSLNGHDSNGNGVHATNGTSPDANYLNGKPLPRINTDVSSPSGTPAKQKTPLSPSAGTAVAPRKTSFQLTAPYVPPTIGPNENRDSPEVKKKLVLAAGPVLRLEAGNETAYGMKESLFTAMKDMFETIMASETRTGVFSPKRLVDVVKRENELFRSTMHQDAHEFLGYVLNEVVENVEAHSRKVRDEANAKALTNGGGASTPKTLGSETSTSTNTALNTGWIHSLFEGQLSSETKCLTCETISRRHEVFLDLSIDLEKHTSITSCLRAFSASEMLCERNKFHCDTCGGLQEAEKRMKVRRLPRILALHLKRFKYVEEVGRHQKLFHRVVYPYYLRLFNTTDDCDDPDRLYELYAVVVHIGGGPYHGHYVAIVKTETKGWLLFDDELVEPVDKAYVKNFFGDKQGLAAAYVLFYQETTVERMRREMEEEGEEPVVDVSMDAEEKTPVAGSAAAALAHLAHHDRVEGYKVDTYSPPQEAEKQLPPSPKLPQPDSSSSPAPLPIHHVPTQPTPTAITSPLPPTTKIISAPTFSFSSRKDKEKEKAKDKDAKKDKEDHGSFGKLKGSMKWGLSGKGGRDKKERNGQANLEAVHTPPPTTGQTSTATTVVEPGTPKEWKKAEDLSTLPGTSPTPQSSTPSALPTSTSTPEPLAHSQTPILPQLPAPSSSSVATSSTGTTAAFSGASGGREKKKRGGWLKRKASVVLGGGS